MTVESGLLGCKLVEQLARAVLLAGVSPCTGQRERLPERPAPCGGQDDHPCERRPLDELLPLLLAEVGLRRHRYATPGAAFGGITAPMIHSSGMKMPITNRTQ